MIISKTPLRMSFIGGGSDIKDYYQKRGGAVLSTAINKYVYITINKRFIDDIRIGYSQTEECKKVDDINHNLVREALKLVGGIDKGIEIIYTSDVLPAHEGSGLGGSSAILIGTLNALHAFKGEHVSQKQLAEEACKIEIDILGHPIGKQDQHAVAFGGLNHILFNQDESVFVNPIIFKKEVKEKLMKNLLLFYTNINTRSDTVLTEQKSKTEENLDILDKMVELSYELSRELRRGNLNSFGEILHKNWMFKKSLASKITNPQIEEWYDLARNAGAVGGKILGSGGGGFLLFYCEEENQEKVRQALSDLKELPFEFELQGSKIIYVGD
jgi:D-glycero-alpha-D-manno-heptose-7-phosphate kinase